jgi:NTE family protein
VVLGSGGATGGAWEIGVLKGLGDVDIDLTRADLFVGSSVGAVLGCQIQSGQSVADLYAARTRPPSSLRAPSPVGQQEHRSSAADLQYFQECLRLWGRAREDIAVRIELGIRALATLHPVPEELQIEFMRRRLAMHGWPSRLVKVAAVDVSDGTVRFFDASQGVPIEVAVAASCAQPGLQAPVRVGNRRYMDGGTAGTNIDGAAGYAIIIAVTAFPAQGRSRQEIDEVCASGGQVIHAAPDAEARKAMGPDPSDVSRVRIAAEAGARQGREIAPAARNLWSRTGG